VHFGVHQFGLIPSGAMAISGGRSEPSRGLGMEIQRRELKGVGWSAGAGVVKQFHALEPAAAWELLASREPQLAGLESETQRGVFTKPVSVIGNGRSPSLQTNGAPTGAGQLGTRGPIERAGGATQLSNGRVAPVALCV
jgi:hypothetical protein